MLRKTISGDLGADTKQELHATEKLFRMTIRDDVAA